MRLALPLLAALALAACSREKPADGETADDYAARSGVSGDVPQVAEINAQPLKADEGDAMLTPLAKDARKALGPVKGGCMFAYQGRTLLTVGAPDNAADKGKGVLVVDGRQMILGGADAGGPQVVESGPTLTDGTWTASVARAEGSPESVGGGNQWPADLVVRGPSGETRFSPGTWTCSL